LDTLSTAKTLTVGEVATLTGFSPQTVTRLFEKERGVIVLNRPTENRKRRYRSIRIPRVVFDRVIRGLSS
jgi:DNA-binding transcriptional MerR regulator